MGAECCAPRKPCPGTAARRQSSGSTPGSYWPSSGGGRENDRLLQQQGRSGQDHPRVPPRVDDRGERREGTGGGSRSSGQSDEHVPDRGAFGGFLSGG